MVTMQQIQERYPHPQKLAPGLLRGKDYCVGGAVCKMVEGPYAADFPSVLELALALLKLNPVLIHSYDHAATIVGANDEGRFDLAWARVEEALTYDPVLTNQASSS